MHAPYKLSETPGSIRAPAPLLGQHTDAVLREYLGMSEETSRPCVRRALLAHSGEGRRSIQRVRYGALGIVPAPTPRTVPVRLSRQGEHCTIMPFQLQK